MLFPLQRCLFKFIRGSFESQLAQARPPPVFSKNYLLCVCCFHPPYSHKPCTWTLSCLFPVPPDCWHLWCETEASSGTQELPLSAPCDSCRPPPPWRHVIINLVWAWSESDHNFSRIHNTWKKTISFSTYNTWRDSFAEVSRKVQSGAGIVFTSVWYLRFITNAYCYECIHG